MELYALLLPAFFLLEIIVILLLYRFVLRGWIIDHWESKIREEEGAWLLDVLSAPINSICDRVIADAPDAILTVLKNELLSSQGTLTRMHKGNGTDEQEVGLEMAEMLLKELGLKSPSALMSLRAGKALLGMFEAKKEGTGSGTGTSSLPVGKELLQGFLG